MSEITVPQLIKSEKLRNSDFEFFFDNGTILKIPYEIKQPLHNRSKSLEHRILILFFQKFCDQKLESKFVSRIE